MRSLFCGCEPLSCLCFGLTTFTTCSICPSSHAEVKRHKERKAKFSLSPSPFAVVWEDVCHRYLFILGGKVLSPHVFSELTNIGPTAANCALQQALNSLVRAGGLDTLLTSALTHLKKHCEGGRGEQLSSNHQDITVRYTLSHRKIPKSVI